MKMRIKKSIFSFCKKANENYPRKQENEKKTEIKFCFLLLPFFSSPSCVIYHPPLCFSPQKGEKKWRIPPLSFFPEVTSPSPLTTWSDWLTLLSPDLFTSKKSREKTVSVRPCTVKKGHLEEKKALFCWFILVLYLSLSLSVSLD